MELVKFRVWDRVNKKMMPVANISFGDDGKALTVIVWDKTQEGYDRPLVIGENADLMQYTGVKDSHGNEIWEGDRMIGKDVIWICRWSAEYCRFIVSASNKYNPHGNTIKSLKWAAERLGVIGNQYEDVGLQEIIERKVWTHANRP